MNYKRILIILIIIVIGKLSIDFLFKIRYNYKQIYILKEFKLNDTVKINHGKIVLGRNIKGFLEATIYPEPNSKLNDSSTIDYLYLRFNPDWFESNIKPFIESQVTNDRREYVNLGKAMHDTYFSTWMHINDYPIISNEYIHYIIKIKESGIKIQRNILLRKE